MALFGFKDCLGLLMKLAKCATPLALCFNKTLCKL